MKEVDYLIVGFGIAGACFAKHCIDENKSFHIISDFKPKASMVAAGMFNPIILFRFTSVHRSIEHMELLQKTFGEFEELLQEKLLHYKKIYRIFANDYEAKIWQKKIPKKPVLQRYLNPEIIYEKYDAIHAPFGFGEVKECGWVDMSLLIEKFHKKYKTHFTEEPFDYNLLDADEGVYKNIKAQKIIFAEGDTVEFNPYFDFVPIIKNKGETLIIKTDADLPDIIFKSKNFLMPLYDNLYYVGATYDKEDLSPTATEAMRSELLEKLETYFKGTYEVVEHRVAFRPTLDDRRGVIGQHSTHKRLYILNGMGTRGTFHAPSMSKYLFDFLENNIPYPKEYGINRYQELISK